MDIETMTFKLPMKMGSVNCYLLGSGSERVMIDTGPTRARGNLEWALQDAECEPGDLSLIVVTHADPDHTGNCAFLRDAFKTKIAVHTDESPGVKSGDLTATRSNMTSGSKRLAKVASPLMRLKKPDRFKPSMTLEGGEKLKSYGVDALVVHTPGHSNGSVSILTSTGELFCGDLMENVKGPRPGSIVDDPDAQAASIDRVRQLGAKRVYPGHGEPFDIDELE